MRIRSMPLLLDARMQVRGRGRRAAVRSLRGAGEPGVWKELESEPH